jgi:EAL domain-containing protein (putative c-di-GMP-specific phosphodiesterase class I)
MLENHEDKAIIEGVLSLAKVFGRQVIAEGVETAEHGQMLLRMGCELAQGYGIARPMPGVEIPEWVKNWRPDSRWVGVADAPDVSRPAPDFNNRRCGASL